MQHAEHSTDYRGEHYALWATTYWTRLADPFLCPNLQADLFSFHETHFGGTAVTAFGADYLRPEQGPEAKDDEGRADEEYYEYYEEEEDDGLGYYPDGVKRTLTDEQIAMFRHSEIRSLQKAREEAQQRSEHRWNTSSPIPMDLEGDSNDEEEGELQDDSASLERKMTPCRATGHAATTAVTTSTKKKKKNKKKKRGSGNGGGNAGNKHWEPDPERRKRTWDIVETGLDALDYGEMDKSGGSAERVAQRRRVTYDDD